MNRCLPPCHALLLCASLLPAATSAAAGESYLALGLPGVQLGYAHSLGDRFGLRADVGTTGRLNRDGTESGIDYAGHARYGRVGLFGDWFPLAGGFRLTGGITVNEARLSLKSRFDGATPVTINGRSVVPAASDYFNADVKMPTTMPYLGIGWGHQARERGLGFVGDLGVSIGRARFSTDTNLVGRYGITQDDVDSETQDLRESVGRLRVLPTLSLGVSYRY